MEFIIQKEYFYKAISDVSKAVSVKTPFPILTGIKMTVDDSGLKLVGSNSDIMIEKFIPITMDGEKILEVYETGSVVVSAKYVNEVVKKLPHKIHLKVKENQLVMIQSNEIKTALHGFNSEEYPRLPQIDEAKCIQINRNKLIEIIKQTAFAASRSESRPILTGVNMSFRENQLSCTATNSQRLASRKIHAESNVKGSFNVPSVSLQELAKLITNEAGVINIFVTDSFMVFKSNTASLYSRLIEGNYPNTSGLFPTDLKTKIILSTQPFLQAIDRSCLFSSEGKNSTVLLEIIDGKKLKISSASSEIGKIEETQKIKEIQGETHLRISLDGTFLIDALRGIKEQEIYLSFNGSMRPVLIEPINNASYFQLISPVRSY
ncbi:DNA polymerase III subunit beta [Bacillus massiliglaciei]|uniref:DNA polymerase III subunit beta n=1 Tax=Bacillus massiliglaciei TaxID=1816693 RepID=UPI000AA2219B|nr:DNA polymerase III subunit beta [Bacillus massiliglaciei]